MKPAHRQAGSGESLRSRRAGKAILRDHLARDRTVMALERTLLAYGRTAFFLVSTCVTVLKFMGDEPAFLVIGAALGLAALATVVFGTRRFLAFRKKLETMPRDERG